MSQRDGGRRVGEGCGLQLSLCVPPGSLQEQPGIGEGAGGSLHPRALLLLLPVEFVVFLW